MKKEGMLRVRIKYYTFIGRRRNVLAVGAHADDVEIGCGGTVALHARNGDNVIILIMAESSYTYYNGTVLRTKEEAEIEERSCEDIGRKGVDKSRFQYKGSALFC